LAQSFCRHPKKVSELLDFSAPNFTRTCFGIFKTLTKAIIQSNAMVRYLDNVDNRKGKLNENLSRELLNFHAWNRKLLGGRYKKWR
jgi:uncharacterized protein (DUF1800 family)